MAVYDIEGTKYTLPDDLTQEEKNAFFESKMSKGDSSPQPSAPTAAAPVEEKTLYDIDLQHDPDYVAASKLIYSKREGKPFSGSDSEAADYGTNMMGWFNYNLPVMALNANRMRTADPDEAKSFLYLMDTYDKLGVSWNGAGRALKGIATDPTSYIGLTTLGIGTAAGQATKVASKAAVKEALTLAVRSGIEGGVMGAAQAALEQQTRVNAGGQDAVDPTKVLTGAAIGGAFGGALGGAGSVAGTALRKAPVEQIAQEASGAAETVKGTLPSQNALSAAGDATVPLERASPETAPPQPVMPDSFDTGANRFLSKEQPPEPANDGGKVFDTWESRRDTLAAETESLIQKGADNVAGDMEALLAGGEMTPLTLKLPNYQTGKPTVVDAFHGTNADFIHKEGFSEEYLGTATGAKSAEEATFFARNPETSNSYVREVEHDAAPIRDHVVVQASGTLGEREILRALQGEVQALHDKIYDAASAKYKKALKKDWENPGPEPSDLAAQDPRNAELKVLEERSNSYANEIASKYREKPNMIQSRIKFDNPLVYDFKGESYREVTYYDLIKQAKEQGHDGAIFLNTKDGGPNDVIYAVFKKENIGHRFDNDSRRAAFKAEQSLTRDPGVPKPPANLSQETQSVLQVIRNIASDTTDMQGFPTGRQEIDIKFNRAVEQLSDMSPPEVDRFIDDLRQAELRGEEMSGAKSVLKQFNDLTAEKHSEALERALSGDTKALDEMEKLQLILDRVTKADTDFSSMSGTDLSNRVGSFNTGDMRDITPTSILKEKGINPELATTEQKLKASQEYDRLYKAYLDKIEAQPRMQELSDELSKALDEGDYGKANVIQTELDGIRKAETAALNDSLPTKTKDAIVKGQQALIEWMVGGALSTSSALVNTLMSGVQTVIRPLSEYVGNNPISRAEFNRLSGTYGAMITQSDVALKKALLAFRYEETITGTDYSRFLENAPVIPGTVGKAVRFFPNLLNSTDQFFAHLNYMGYVNGTAAAQATEKATDLGLKGSMREKFIKDEMSKAVNSAYIDPGINSLFNRVRDQGIKRGYKGDKLSLFIKTELNKNGELLHEASELQGINYMKDTLFKREFTGEHEGTKSLSALARGYEDTMNKVPILRALQLFFRTPVRVAEQVARLTPGLNTVVLFNDLKGQNGPQRQARAYGEMFLSQAIAAKALVEYAEGKGSGSGPDDFREKRLQEQSGKKFSAQFDGEGNALGLNNLDPLFGPKKIIWSTLDRMAMIQYRKAQGEYVGEEEKAAKDMLMSGFISLFVTIKDMNMLGGLQEVVKAGTVMFDPKQGEDAATQFRDKKIASLIPGLISKSLNLYGADPEKTDPKTLWQFVQSRIDPADLRIPRQYDAIGKAVEVTNPVAAITGLDLSSRAMRHGSDSPKEIAVKEELARIATATKASFTMPYKLPETQFGDLDLRENYTADGKETLYDRMQRYYRESGVTDALHSYVVEMNGGYGTEKDDGPKAIAAKTIINKFHQYAAGKLFMEEEKLMDARMKRAAGKMDAVLGKKEVFGFPYSQ